MFVSNILIQISMAYNYMKRIFGEIKLLIALQVGVTCQAFLIVLSPKLRTRPEK